MFVVSAVLFFIISAVLYYAGWRVGRSGVNEQYAFVAMFVASILMAVSSLIAIIGLLLQGGLSC